MPSVVSRQATSNTNFYWGKSGECGTGKLRAGYGLEIGYGYGHIPLIGMPVTLAVVAVGAVIGALPRISEVATPRAIGADKRGRPRRSAVRPYAEG